MLNRTIETGIAIAVLTTVSQLVGQQNPVSSHVADPTTPTAPTSGKACAKEDSHNPRVKTKVEPQYTFKARRKGANGVVTVKLLVDEQGIPQHVSLFEGIDEELNKKAIEACPEMAILSRHLQGRACVDGCDN